MNLLKKISEHDKNLSTESSIRGTTALALRSWQAYRYLEPAAEMRIHLQRANHAVTTMHKRNAAHIKLYTLAIFIAIESGYYDSANGMLDKALTCKSWLKQNEPLYYGTFCALYAYLELKQRRVRSAKKHWRALTDHAKNAAPSPHYSIMQGLLHLTSQEYPEAYNHLSQAYAAGSRSIFLYEGLYRYYKTSERGFEGTNLLPVLIYAAKRGADISHIAGKYPETLSTAIKADPPAGEKLYKASNYAPILKDICSHRIEQGDASPQAFALYQDAEKKQIFIPELFSAIINAAYVNNAKKINHYTLSKFLHDDPDLETEAAVYIFHHILTDPAHAGLIPDVQSKILQLGARCLEQDMRGREVNSIYYYLWTRFRALGIKGVDLDKAEEILRLNLTHFEITLQENSAVKFIYITEPEKRGMTAHEIKDNKTTMELISQNASYTCLGTTGRTIVNEEITITPMVAHTGVELYLYFFQKGDRRFHLLAFLANYYLSLETTPDEAAPIFEALLEQKQLTKPYKMRLLVALGGLHYNAFSFEQALECYAEVDETALDPEHIEQILNVYLQTREYTRAANLLAKKHEFIHPETQFAAAQKLIKKPESQAVLAPICYHLLQNGYVHEELLQIVLAHFDAGYQEWASLSQTMDEENIPAPQLDAKVLECALYMSQFDQFAQKAFSRLYNHTDANQSQLIQFAELAIYEMLAKNTRPNYDVIVILEKIFAARNDDDDFSVLLSWGLAGVFIKNNITTLKSEEIITYAITEMENAGIILPALKEHNQTLSPFIEKYQPFIYKCLPNKQCKLYYRIEGETSFSVTPMQYIRFGIYIAAIPLFYNETVTYYFSEEMPSGSINTKEQTIKNTKPFLYENDLDTYYKINNAIIYEQMFKHDKVEKLVSELVKENKRVRGALL